MSEPLENLFLESCNRIENKYVELLCEGMPGLGWRFLYSSRNTLNSDTKIIFIGSHPGGKEAEMPLADVESSEGNAYISERWNKNKKGEKFYKAHQLQVQALFKLLAGNLPEDNRQDWKELMNSALISNFSLFRFPEWKRSRNFKGMAVYYWTIDEAIAAAGTLAGKIIIDATNPYVRNEAGEIQRVPNVSSALELAQKLPQSKIVKAYNTLATRIFADEHHLSNPYTLFYCGDDAIAKSIVSQLIADSGFVGIDTGKLSNVINQEPGGVLYISKT